MKLGIYIRVSSEEQTKGNSLETQEKSGIEFCEYNNYSYQTYREEGASGTLYYTKLPALTKLLTDLKKGTIDGIYASKLDRLTRNEDNWKPIIEALNETNSKLFIDGAELDIHDYDMVLMLGIKQKLATHEIQRLKYRIEQGIKSGMLKGHSGGGRVQPYGYKTVDKMLTICPIEKKIVKKIYKLSLEGKGTKAISTILNDEKVPTKLQSRNKPVQYKQKTYPHSWRDSVIYEILTNPIYTGNRRFKSKLYYFENLKIIDQDLFDAVQIGLKNRNRFKRTNNKYFYLLNGLITCSCGSSMAGRIKPSRGERLYRCNSKRGHISTNCGNRSYNLDELNKAVLRELTKLPELVAHSLKKYVSMGGVKFDQKEMDDTQQRINSYNAEITSVFNMKIPDHIKEKRINELHKNIQIDTKRIERLTMNKLYYHNQSKYVEYIENLVKPLSSKSTTDEENQIIVRSLIEEIITGSKDGKRTLLIKYKIDDLTKTKLQSKFELDLMNYQEFKHNFQMAVSDQIVVHHIDL